jgi:hypothetical protein
MSTGQTNPKQKTKHFSAVRNRCVVTLVNQLEQLETNKDNNTNNPSTQQQKRNETIKVKKNSGISTSAARAAAVKIFVKRRPREAERN